MASSKPPRDLDPVDKEALERALVLIADHPEYARTTQTRLRRDGWFEAASRAAHYLQEKSLRLKPWQPPPMDASAEDAELPPEGPNDVGGKRTAGRLLVRMLNA